MVLDRADRGRTLTDDKYAHYRTLRRSQGGLALGAALQIFKTSAVVGSKATTGDLRSAWLPGPVIATGSSGPDRLSP